MKFVFIYLIISIVIISCKTASHEYNKLWFRTMETNDIVEHYIQRKEMFPNSWEPYFYLGLCYLREALKTGELNYYKKSIEELENAYKLDVNEKTTTVLLYTYKLYSKELENKDEINKSFTYYKKYVTLSDSIYLGKKLKDIKINDYLN
jgi:tetratricopeptide (TPR) repeat protein